MIIKQAIWHKNTTLNFEIIYTNGKINLRLGDFGVITKLGIQAAPQQKYKLTNSQSNEYYINDNGVLEIDNCKYDAKEIIFLDCAVDKPIIVDMVIDQDITTNKTEEEYKEQEIDENWIRLQNMIRQKIDKTEPMALAHFNMNNYRILELASPVNNTDAANKKYIDDGLSNKLNKSGDSMTGNLSMNNNNIVEVGTLQADSSTVAKVNSKDDTAVTNVKFVKESIPTIDTAMSSTSANPVQNKVIKTYVDNSLDDKADINNPVFTGTVSIVDTDTKKAITLDPETGSMNFEKEGSSISGVRDIHSDGIIYTFRAEAGSGSVDNVVSEDNTAITNVKFVKEHDDDILTTANQYTDTEIKKIQIPQTDKEISDSSENPIANKIIKEYVDNLHRSSLHYRPDIPTPNVVELMRNTLLRGENIKIDLGSDGSQIILDTKNDQYLIDGEKIATEDDIEKCVDNIKKYVEDYTLKNYLPNSSPITDFITVKRGIELGSSEADFEGGGTQTLGAIQGLRDPESDYDATNKNYVNKYVNEQNKNVLTVVDHSLIYNRFDSQENTETHENQAGYEINNKGEIIAFIDKGVQQMDYRISKPIYCKKGDKIKIYATVSENNPQRNSNGITLRKMAQYKKDGTLIKISEVLSTKEYEITEDDTYFIRINYVQTNSKTYTNFSTEYYYAPYGQTYREVINSLGNKLDELDKKIANLQI